MLSVRGGEKGEAWMLQGQCQVECTSNECLYPVLQDTLDAARNQVRQCDCCRRAWRCPKTVDSSETTNRLERDQGDIAVSMYVVEMQSSFGLSNV